LSGKLKNSITTLLNESSQFNVNDVLVNAYTDHPKLFLSTGELRFDVASFPKSILRESDKTNKESGVNPLCSAHGNVQLSINGKEVQTPILFTPLLYKRDKLKQLVTFSQLEEDQFLNPFLLKHLESELEIDTQYLFEEDASTEEKYNIQSIQSKLNEVGLSAQYDSSVLIGNFHHHRYQIIKELEELLELDDYSDNLSTLFGFEESDSIEKIDLPPDNLFPADLDHEDVFNMTTNNNLVVQGPPGTGKSQVLTNLLGKILGTNKTTIVVSEKRVALEVLKKKLSAFNLDKLCFIATSDHLSHSFLQELKSTWDYFESYVHIPVNNIRLSEQYEANLQMTMDLLSQKDLIGGVSFHEFQDLSENKKLDRYNYSSQVPDISDYLTHKPIIELIYSSKINSSIGRLKSRTISSSDFGQFDKKISNWKSSLLHLEKTFDFTTWEDFKSIMKDAALCQVYENDLHKKYAGIFEAESKEQKRFLSLRKKYMQARLEVEQINSNRSHWKITPSEIETVELHNVFENGSFFSRLKAKKRWKDISPLPVSQAFNQLSKHIDEIAKINSYSQIIIKFCELGLDDPENEVALIHQTLRIYSQDQWVALEKIPIERRFMMTSHHKELNILHHDLKSHFNFENNVPILKYLQDLENGLAQILSKKDDLKKLDENALLTLSRNESKEDYEGEILHSHWVQFKERFPSFSNFKISDIKEKIQSIISVQLSEAKLYATEIENTIHKSFVAYHEILNTPARKLSEDQKQFKARLRKGKSILVKEFSKVRSHPSLREIYNSDAREWIQLLKPIWLSNPTQLAKCFPLEMGMFDFTIFDEASQVPLQNALGAIQRSKRVVVAGDEHQMGPSAYFKSGSTEYMDLLHQANYNWKKVSLHHHYRSVHPDLIAFSNKHFYNNDLKAYPSYGIETPLRFHFLKDGKFIDRRNNVEARAIAEYIEIALTEDKSIGVVAFSEEQLNCIWEELSAKSQQKITEKIGKNQGFFKALENVQGDECDRLFISFGYAPNEDGDFHMRFGPMNTANGRKRLNVLLTRAIESLDFFCSVKSSDFKLSDNESINLLRQWISFAEEYSDKNQLSFPFGLKPGVRGNQLTFYKIQETLPLAKELVTLESVLENRGWVVQYC
jgi:AAA domain